MNQEETTPSHSEDETSSHSEAEVSSDDESEEQKKTKSFLNFSRGLMSLLLTGTTGLMQSEKANRQQK